MTVGTKRTARARARDAAAQVGQLVGKIRHADDAAVEDALITVSRRHRLLAPLALVVGGFVALFDGLKLLVSNWRLTLVQLLPAMWIWLALTDLKAHVLRGAPFTIVTGPLLAVVVIAIVAVTALSFFLNAVFAFAITSPGTPDTRAGRARAWEHRGTVLAWGSGIGVLLAFSTVVVTRWGGHWFTVCLGIVVALMMVLYVTVPARLIGVPTRSRPRRERLTASLVGATLGAVVATPPYLLGRLGLVMLGSSVLAVPGALLFVLGLTLQAGAISSVKAVKLSATFVAAREGGE